MSKEKVKETKVQIPIVKVLMLANGMQVIAGVTHTEGSTFVRLTEPYKIRIHESVLGDKIGFVEEKMSLTPLVFQTTDRVYSILRTHIITIGSPNKNLTEYYDNVRLGLFPTIKKEIEPLMTKQQHDNSFEKAMEEMSDEDYFQTLEYLRGKIKAN